MAYGLIMLAVSSDELRTFLRNLKTFEKRQDYEKIKTYHIVPNKQILTSHYFASAGVEDKEMDELIQELFDGGELFGKYYWHPFRPPKYHDHESLKILIKRFLDRWKNFLTNLPEDEIEYWKIDFDPIIELFNYILINKQDLITLLDKPFDEERAKKVFGPIKLEDNPKL